METNIIQIIDQIGSQRETIELVVPSLTMTVRELINLRVHHEYMKAKMALTDTGRPNKTPAEIKKGVSIQFAWMDMGLADSSSWESEAEKAQKMFVDGRFFIFVGNAQVEGLETQIVLEPDAVVQFIKIIPLIGG